MSTGPAPRTLADQLRSWPTERLARLLETRPDLTTPAPRDSAQLAARAVVRSSVQRTLEQLDRLHLVVLEAVAALSASGPTSLPAVQSVVYGAPAAVAQAVQALGDRALVWGTDEQLRATGVVAELLLLPPGAPLERVPALVEALDPAAKALLDHLDSTDADGYSERPVRVLVPEQATTPTEQLLARRLLVPRDEHHVALPWSVRLALRDGRSTRAAVDQPPALATSERDAALLDRTAAGAALELVERAAMLLEHWGTHPAGALRTGGLGVRELKATTAFLHLSPEVTTLLVETAAAAGLLDVGMTDDLDAAWLPTDAFDQWLAADTAARWEVLASAWLRSPRLATTRRDVLAPPSLRGGKPANALAPGLEQPWVPEQRRTILEQLATCGPGETLAAGTGLGSLHERLRWLHPRRPVGHLQHVDPTLRDAAALGIVGLEGLSSFGRALLAGAGADVLGKLLPAPVDQVLLQADLTAIAPGPLTSELARALSLVAEVESRGGATTYRFSATSVRRAFDAGWSAAEVHDFLRGASRTPVPQALEYLVDDVARRFGTIRAGHAAAFLRSDDEAALAALVHDPRASNLRLRLLAPTVLVSDVPLDTLLPRLRELGLAPVVEAIDGTVRVARPDVFRSRTPKVVTPSREIARGQARISAVVTAVRAGDRAAAERPTRGPATTPADVLTLLRTAVEERVPVLIGYLDDHGTSTERRVQPERVEGGRLTAYDERSDDVRAFAVHRITSAARTS